MEYRIVQVSELTAQEIKRLKLTSYRKGGMFCTVLDESLGSETSRSASYILLKTEGEKIISWIACFYDTPCYYNEWILMFWTQTKFRGQRHSSDLINVGLKNDWFPNDFHIYIQAEEFLKKKHPKLYAGCLGIQSI